MLRKHSLLRPKTKTGKPNTARRPRRSSARLLMLIFPFMSTSNSIASRYKHQLDEGAKEGKRKSHENTRMQVVSGICPGRA